MFSFLFGSGSNSPTNNASTKPTTFKDIPKLIVQLEGSSFSDNADVTYEASKRLYGLCDVAHKYNRVPMLSGQDYDVLTPICETLMNPNTPANTQHVLCLTLNNLSVPLENKKVMATSKIVIESLYHLVSTPMQSQEATHFACICLVNLSYLEENSILKYIPVTVGTDMTLGPVEHPHSLLRKIELLALDGGTDTGTHDSSATSVKTSVQTESPPLLLDLLSDNTSTTTKATTAITETQPPPSPNSPKHQLPSKVISENQRWACALLKTFARQRENAIMMGRTQYIPTIVAHLLQNQQEQHQQLLWARHSCEESCLAIVVYLSQWTISRTALIEAGTPQILQDYVDPTLETLELEKEQQQQQQQQQSSSRTEKKDASSTTTTPSLIVLSTLANAMLGICPFDYFTTKQIFELQKRMAYIYQHRTDHHDFGLATVVQGYKCIAKAAQTSPTAIPIMDSQQDVMMTLISKRPTKQSRNHVSTDNDDDDDDDDDTTVSIVAPCTLALLYQLISDIVFEDEIGNEDEEMGSGYDHNDPHGTGGRLQVSDVMAAEHAVGAIEILLPLILQGGSSSSSNANIQNTKRAVAEISMLLKNFSKIDGISQDAQTSSKNAAYTMIKYCYDTPTIPKPTLEQSHMNWIRKRFRP